MVKGLLPIALLLSASPFLVTRNDPSPSYKEAMNVSTNSRENNTLDSLKTVFDGEYRLYRYNDLLVDEVSDHAFDGQKFNTLVLSNCVTHISNAVFENASNITTLQFTGSEEEYKALGITYEFSAGVSYYAVDEGFINYWNEAIRPTSATNICNISDDQFRYVYDLYKQLNENDLKTVNAYIDASNAKIEDSMKELIQVFRKSDKTDKKDEWNQTGAIILIIFIAVIGMTSITVFFLLKTKRIID